MTSAAEAGATTPTTGEERVPLSSEPSRSGLRRGLRRNFMRMSLCFALNHACVTAALALSTANLGPVLGNASNAVLYVFYTSTALLYAGPHVRWRGSKAALVDSTFGFCIYVGSFYVAEVWAPIAWGAAVVGAAVGGIAAGILFTAQGVYFTLTARAYAQLSHAESESAAQGEGGNNCGADDDNVDDLGRHRLGMLDRAMEEATALFASTFATIYLLSEITFKLIAWILPMYWPAGWAVVSLTYFATAVVAAVGMATIWHLDAESEDPADASLGVAISPWGSSDKDSLEEKPRSSTNVRHHTYTSEPQYGDGSGTARSPAFVLESDPAPVPPRYSPSPHLASESDVDPARTTGFGYLRELLLLLCERQMLLAMGLNLAYGFTSAYLTSHVNGTIVARAYGTAAIGLFSAITPAVAGLASPVLGYCSSSCKTKQPVMILGTMALFMVVVVPAVADSAGLWELRGSSTDASAEARYGSDSLMAGADSSIGSEVDSPAALLAVIYILEGVGRGVFEGPNRSIYADWFENQREMAFACWIIQSGGSASIAFFMLALDVTPSAVGALGLLCAVFAAPGFVLGDRMFRRERTASPLLARP